MIEAYAHRQVRALRLRFGAPRFVLHVAADLVGSLVREWLGFVRREFLAGSGQDLRFAVRRAMAHPFTTTIAVATLAIGLGVNVAIYSVVRGVLLRPLPYTEPARLVTLHSHDDASGVAEFSFTKTEFESYRDSLAAFATVGGDFLTDLTVTGGDPDAIGNTLTLNGLPFHLLGVVEPGFRHPRADVDVYVPYTLGTDDWIGCWLDLSALLAPGVTVAQAQSEIDALQTALAARHARSDGYRVTVRSLGPGTRSLPRDRPS